MLLEALLWHGFRGPARLEDDGLEAVVRSLSNTVTLAFSLDNPVVRDALSVRTEVCCDGLFLSLRRVSEQGPELSLLFLELKGKNIAHAVDQIESALVAVQRGQGLHDEPPHVLGPHRRIDHPGREQRRRRLRPHRLADAHVDQQLGQQPPIDHRRQGPAAERLAHPFDVLERQRLQVRGVGADDADPEHQLEHVVRRQRVHATIADPPEQIRRQLARQRTRNDGD